jgi:hypothetical protein
MRAIVQYVRAWTGRHALVCRLTGLAVIVALAAGLSVSAERQRTLVTSYHPLPHQKSFLEANFWREDEESLRAWRERKREWEEHGEAAWRARLPEIFGQRERPSEDQGAHERP